MNYDDDLILGPVTARHVADYQQRDRAYACANVLRLLADGPATSHDLWCDSQHTRRSIASALTRLSRIGAVERDAQCGAWRICGFFYHIVVAN